VVGVLNLHGGQIRAHSEEIPDSSVSSRKGTAFEMEMPCVMIDGTVERPANYENFVIRQSSCSVAEEYANHNLTESVQVPS
jgi:hypothetical protein